VEARNYDNADLRPINVNGADRSYILRAPVGEVKGLIFAYHGGGGDASTMERMCGDLNAEAHKIGCAVIYPDGVPFGKGKVWPRTEEGRSNDEAFLKALKERLTHQICNGKNVPVLLSGHSMGGWLAVYLAMLGYANALVLNATSVLQSDLDLIRNNKSSFDVKRIELFDVTHIQDHKDNNVPLQGGYGAEAQIEIYHLSHKEGIDKLIERNGFVSGETVARHSKNCTTFIYDSPNGVQIKSILTQDGGHSIAGGNARNSSKAASFVGEIMSAMNKALAKEQNNLINTNQPAQPIAETRNVKYKGQGSGINFSRDYDLYKPAGEIAGVVFLFHKAGESAKNVDKALIANLVQAGNLVICPDGLAHNQFLDKQTGTTGKPKEWFDDKAPFMQQRDLAFLAEVKKDIINKDKIDLPGLRLQTYAAGSDDKGTNFANFVVKEGHAKNLDGNQARVRS
jgi:poly(3-hydroxybutyrate) depolymerase